MGDSPPPEKTPHSPQWTYTSPQWPHTSPPREPYEFGNGGARGFTRGGGPRAQSPLPSARGREGGAWKGGRPRGGAEGGAPGVPAAAAEVRGKREGPHLRNPPPAAAAAASLRPGDLGARGRLARHTQTPASGGASSSEELG